jgi:hypothetical protein
MIFILKFLLLVLLFQQFLKRVSNKKAGPLPPLQGGISPASSHPLSSTYSATSTASLPVGPPFKPIQDMPQDKSASQLQNVQAYIQDGTHCQVWEKDHEDFEEYLKLRFPHWEDTEADDTHATLAQIYWQEWWQTTEAQFPTKPKNATDTLYQAGLTSYLRRVWVQFKIINFDPHTPYIPVSIEEINSLIPSGDDYNPEEFNKTHAAKALSDANAELSTFLAQLQSDPSDLLLEGILELYEGDGIFSAEHTGKGNYSADIKKQLFVPGAMELAFFYLQNHANLYNNVSFRAKFANGFLYQEMHKKYQLQGFIPQEHGLRPPEAATLFQGMLCRGVPTLSTEIIPPWRANKQKSVQRAMPLLPPNDPFWVTPKQSNGEEFNDHLAMLVLLSTFNPLLNKDKDKNKCYQDFRNKHTSGRDNGTSKWPDSLTEACNQDNLQHVLSEALFSLEEQPEVNNRPRMHSAQRLLRLAPASAEDLFHFEPRTQWIQDIPPGIYPSSISLGTSLSFKDSSSYNARTGNYELQTTWLLPGCFLILQPKESMFQHISAGGRWMHGSNAVTSFRQWDSLKYYVQPPNHSDINSEYFISAQPCAIGYLPCYGENDDDNNKFEAWIAATAVTFWTSIQNITAFVVTATSTKNTFAVCPNGIVTATEAAEFKKTLEQNAETARTIYAGDNLTFDAALSCIQYWDSQEKRLSKITAAS